VDRAAVLLGVLAVTAALALWWRGREGRVRHTSGTSARAAAAPPVAVEAPVTLLELTAPGCAPCAQAKAVLESVASQRTAVAVRTLDVADAEDLVHAHRVLRAPTTLVLDAAGEVRAVVGGVPRREDLEAAVDRLLDAHHQRLRRPAPVQ
jgi:thiol-disulfide isomerase/thioredoxin